MQGSVAVKCSAGFFCPEDIPNPVNHPFFFFSYTSPRNKASHTCKSASEIWQDWCCLDKRGTT